MVLVGSMSIGITTNSSLIHLVMNKVIFYFALILTPLNLLSQDIIIDSIQYVRQCNCEKSAGKYRDQSGRVFQVFLDRPRNKIFIIRRRKGYFVREVLTEG
jgi:hypothetical protein